MTNVQFSTVAMIATAAGKATIAERTSSTPYGVARHSWLGDVDRDGDGGRFVTFPRRPYRPADHRRARKHERAPRADRGFLKYSL